FRTTLAERQHPIMKSFGGFESWDETYVHHKHNEKDRTVLEYRTEGDAREPWTWVKPFGKGRVFYTAWGHDARTWSNPGFQNLVERGIRWAVGNDPGEVPAYADRPEMTKLRKDVAPFEFTEAKIPFYPAGKQWGTQAEPITKMQKPLEPAESQKHYVTPVGFELQLFAAEPDIGKPICMAWDERGRLWLAETVDYPNELQKPGQGRDRIRICEDADGDGKADKFTVFAEKLSIPTSILISRGGVIVHQAPDTLFLRDTDGDDKADERTVLFTGWSTGDTHAGPSNLRYGLDNWIYGMVGYAGFEGEIGGVKQSFRTGFYRFRPDASQFEFLRNTNNNSWGVGLSEEGILFGSTANGNPSEYMPVANHYYEGVKGWSSSVLNGIADSNKFEAITENVRQVDHHGGFTAAAGHALYTARTYPQEYWNRTAFVTEPTGHLIATFVIRPNGAGFTSKNSWNLAAADDEWAAPIAAEVGPDGHVWMIDWYNFIVQHNPTPQGFKTGKGNAYESDVRDKRHGRVYRVVYKSGPETKPLSLAGANPEQLVETLKHPNQLWRLHAQRLLVERGERDVVPKLLELVKNPEVDAIGLNPGAIHALWTLQGLGVLDGSQTQPLIVAANALQHPSAGVRRNAVQVLPHTAETASLIAQRGLLNDVDAQVRLAALLALADADPSPAAAQAVVEVFGRKNLSNDRWLLDAATSAAARNDVEFLSRLAAGSSELDKERLARVTIVAEHYARGFPQNSIATVVAALPSASPAMAEAVLTGLERGWPKGKSLPEIAKMDEGLVKLLKSLPASARGRLISLASRWGSHALAAEGTAVADAFLSQVKNENLKDGERVQAAGELIDFRKSDPKAADALLELISPRLSPDLSRGLIEAAGRSEAPEVANSLIAAMKQATPAARTAGIRALLGRTEWTPALLTALEQGEIPVGELTLDQKQSLARHPDRQIAQRSKKLLARGGGLPDADRQKVLDQLLPLASRTGSVEAGKVVFTKQCSKCHTHNGEGTKIGPDLTGMAVHPKAELLMHIIDPSRSVEGNFRVYTVVTTDGRVMNGLLASESKTAVEIIDGEAKRHAIQRDDVEELVASTKSLMPEGFEKQLSTDDWVNLLEFLTHRGRYLPIPLDKAATVVSTRGMFFEPEGQAERMIFSDWSPKTVDGVPFQLIDPRDDRIPNAILLNGPEGKVPPTMPKSVTLPCNAPAKAIHFLSGVSGWGWPIGEKGSVSMIVRLHYADGKQEDHPLKNGEEFADYIRRVDVPGSKFAFALRTQQIRYLSITPKRHETIETIELVKGADRSAPIVMAVTVESE
ncbi:MAG TPA: PVC-type heme-binding CxxCH protein, partial [Planctomycetaceae bacterium]|nr:PVC-type heme-binding CxxCH protein [Planctomycetaceae bacterium]